MSLHYLGKHNPQKLCDFTYTLYIALPTNRETLSNYQLVTAEQRFIINKILQ